MGAGEGGRRCDGRAESDVRRSGSDVRTERTPCSVAGPARPSGPRWRVRTAATAYWVRMCAPAIRSDGRQARLGSGCVAVARLCISAVASWRSGSGVQGLNSFVQKCGLQWLGRVRVCAGGNRLCKNAGRSGTARVRVCARREDACGSGRYGGLPAIGTKALHHAMNRRRSRVRRRLENSFGLVRNTPLLRSRLPSDPTRGPEGRKPPARRFPLMRP